MGATGQYTDNELLGQVAAGNHSAYKQVFDTYYSSLVFFARSIIEEHAQAEDIVQETFGKVWINRAELLPDANLSSFLYTSVRNRCIDYLRAEKRQTTRHHELLRLAQQEAGEIETSAYYEEVLRIVLLELNALPEKYRQILQMIYFDGLKYKDISEQLQLSEATIRKQKERALTMIQQNIWQRNDPLILSVGQIIFLLSLVTKA